MTTREDLHEELVKALGSRYVYFQPPESIKLMYPCIIYKRVGIPVDKADNMNYIKHQKFTVTVIDEDPDSPIPDRVLELPYSSFDAYYVVENLNHNVFTIFI